MNRFKKFLEELKKYLPKFEVKFKNESTLMKIIGKLLFFNKIFMTSFVTTLGYTVYFPNKQYLDNKSYSGISVLSHEYRHAKDANKISSFLFSILYLCPQIIGLLGLLVLLTLLPLMFLGMISWYWLLVSTSLLFLLPVPAYFRMRYELNGYTMSLFMVNEVQKELMISEENRYNTLKNLAERYNKNFTGPNYYYMWPFGVKNKLHEAIDKIISEEMINEHEVYNEVRTALNNSNY